MVQKKYHSVNFPWNQQACFPFDCYNGQWGKIFALQFNTWELILTLRPSMEAVLSTSVHIFHKRANAARASARLWI